MLALDRRKLQKSAKAPRSPDFERSASYMMPGSVLWLEDKLACSSRGHSICLFLIPRQDSYIQPASWARSLTREPAKSWMPKQHQELLQQFNWGHLGTRVGLVFFASINSVTQKSSQCRELCAVIYPPGNPVPSFFLENPAQPPWNRVLLHT